MIYLLTRPFAWLFAILLLVVRSPFMLVGAIRNHRMRKHAKVAARAAREQQKMVRAQQKAARAQQKAGAA